MSYPDPNDPRIQHVKLATFGVRGGTFTRWAVYRDGKELYRRTQWDDDPPDGGSPASAALKEAA